MESGGREVNGVLFGVSHERELRLLTARRSPDDPDPRLAGLKPLGVYAWRPRGDVFLTEGDLKRFEQSQAAVALVVAGERAGFFVRETNGSLRAIRTHEEFPVIASPPPQPIVQAIAPHAKPPLATAAALTAALVFAAVLYVVRPAPPKALALALKEQSGQLLVRWNPQALPKGGILAIADGKAHIETAVSPGQSSATYQMRTSDVEVKLAGEQRRFVLSSQGPEILKLQQQAEELRKSIWSGSVRIAELEVLTERLTRPEP
jgi:hypothetical protein